MAHDPSIPGGGGIRVAKLRFAQKKIKILHALHNLAKRKKKKTIVVLKNILRWSRFTLTSLWAVLSLSTLYFKRS